MLTEECWYWDECDTYAPFIAAGKAVFAVEYWDQGASLSSVCAVTSPLDFSTLIKNRNLDASLQACP